MSNDVSSEHISAAELVHRVWRMFFGAYLLLYFVQIFPYRIELYGRLGVFENHSLVPWFSYFPPLLLSFDQNEVILAIFVLGMITSGLLIAGVAVRMNALLLWFISIWLFNRNPFSDSPEYGFVNWLLIALIIVPDTNRSLKSLRRLKSLQIAGWITLSVGYLYAAIAKVTLGDPSWLNGTAVHLILTQDNSRRPWFGDFFYSIPASIFMPMTYSILALQILGPVMIAFKRPRQIWWLGMTAMHIGALAISNLNQLSLGMLLFHLFLFDDQWLQPIRKWTRINSTSRYLRAAK